MSTKGLVHDFQLKTDAQGWNILRRLYFSYISLWYFLWNTANKCKHPNKQDKSVESGNQVKFTVGIDWQFDWLSVGAVEQM